MERIATVSLITAKKNVPKWDYCSKLESKIYMIYTNYLLPTGGIPVSIRNISERLAEKELNIEVMSSEAKLITGEEQVNKVTIRTFNIFRFGFFSVPSISWINEIMNIKNSIIHVHGFHNTLSLFSIFFAHKSNVIIFNTYYHGKSSHNYRNPLLKLYLFLFNLIIKKVDAIICISKFELNLVKKDFKFPENKIYLIPSGYNVDQILKYKWDPPNDGITKILYIGRIVKHKNVHKLVEALKFLENAKLTIIGSGDYEDDVRELIEKLGINGKVQWRKNLSYNELLNEYSKNDVFVLPSIYESYGIVVGEAALIGCPIIIANSSSLSEFIEAGLAEALSLPIDSKEIAKKIQVIQGKKNQNSKALDYFKDWDEIADILIDLYLWETSQKIS